jgi:tetratricopeptide (TPR) repeat protein
LPPKFLLILQLIPENMRFKTFVLLFAAVCLLSSCTSPKEKALGFLKSGKVKINKNDLKGGLADLDKALENDPLLDQAWFWRANTKYNLRDVTGALSDYNECIRVNPGCADAYCNRGELKSGQGDKEGACADWKKAKELGKENMRDRLQGCN